MKSPTVSEDLVDSPELADVLAAPPTLEVQPLTLRLPADAEQAARIILDSRCASYWLQEAIRTLLARDPLDARCDAEILCAIAQIRHEEVTR